MSAALDAAGPAGRALHVEHCMGTVFTIDIRDPGDWTAAIADVVERLHHIDATFSTYRADSDISRLGRRELTLAHAGADVAAVLALCADIQDETEGAFRGIQGGRIDPTGLVKGWAVEDAVNRLRARGVQNCAVNGGGDVQAVGESEPGRAWAVGIVDPHDRQRVITVVPVRDGAVATSGTAERGAHIVDPFTGTAATGLASVTVLGPSLTRADAYATAGFVKALDALAWLEQRDGYEGFVVAADGRQYATPGWPVAPD